MGKTCPNCKSSDFDVDPARGDTVCMGCGSVLEENRIVSEVSIQENADGSASVVGQFVASEGSYKPYLSGFQYGMGKDSRQISLDKGRDQIREMAALLNLNRHCTDTAFNFYKMAIAKRLSRGRRINHIVAACLYMTCRTEGTPHMLLDFSDVTQVNVFTLGKVFLLLAKEFHINLPILDPCMYITRFAHRLDFGDKTKDVIVTATRLVCRMKRDWIHTGRRPSGLCGAALLVSARLHGFNCDLDDIKRVVKIGNDTIRKRLSEFQSTPSSQLTINEFMSIDLESEHDPPAYINGRIKAKIQQFETEAGGMENVECELGKISNAIDDDQSTDTEGGTPRKKYRPSKSLQPLPNASTEEYQKDLDLQASSNFVHSENPEALAIKIFSPGRVHKVPSDQKQDGNFTQHGGPAPTLASLGINHPNEEVVDHVGAFKRPYEHVEDGHVDGELDLEGIDDEEIDRLILSPNESAIKSRIWMKEYGEFVVELEEKREKKRIENEKKDKSRQKGKRTKSRYRDYYGDSKTATEAIEKLVNRQRLSNKINYEALRKATEDVESKAADIVLPSTVVDESHLVKKEYVTPQKKKMKLENTACLNPCDDITQDKVLEENEVLPAHEQEEDAEDYEAEEDHCLSASQLMQSAGLGGSGDYYGYDEYD